MNFVSSHPAFNDTIDSLKNEFKDDIDFTGDKEMVDKTIYAMRTYIVNTINAIHEKEQSDLPMWLDSGKPWWLG